MRTLIIFNPYSGRGNALRVKDALLKAVTAAQITYDLVETERPGHATELARRARLDGYALVVAAGGDGTISEVVNGLMEASRAGAPGDGAPGDGAAAIAGTLGVLPIGSGNDFATMTGIPRDFTQAAQRLAQGNLRVVDVGAARYCVDGATHERYFDNNMGIGLEAAVILESNKMRRLRGVLLYAAAAVRALVKHQSPQMQLRWETATGETGARDERMLIVSIGNSPRAGGGFYLTPDAQMDDNLLDVAIARHISRPAVLLLLPRAMAGTHTGHHAVTMLRIRNLTISIPTGAPLQMDGELLAEHATQVDIDVLPHQLQMIA